MERMLLSHRIGTAMLSWSIPSPAGQIRRKIRFWGLLIELIPRNLPLDRDF